MRLKTFLIETHIIGAIEFPFRQNLAPVVAHSASPATLTATAADEAWRFLSKDIFNPQGPFKEALCII